MPCGLGAAAGTCWGWCWSADPLTCSLTALCSHPAHTAAAAVCAWHRLLTQGCATNRLRVMPQQPGIIAMWGDVGSVKLLDATAQLAELAAEEEPKSKQAARVQVCTCWHLLVCAGHVLARLHALPACPSQLSVTTTAPTQGNDDHYFLTQLSVHPLMSNYDGI